MNPPLSLKPEHWPDPERQLWKTAIQPSTAKLRRSAASRWSPSRQRIVAQSLGQWFAWLDRQGLLGLPEKPAERMVEQRISEFAEGLLARVSSASAAMMLGALKRGYDVLAPRADRDWLARMCSELKANASPSRNRFSHLVRPDQLLDLGLKLMEEAQRREAKERTYLVSCLARDGLMLAMLICFPARVGDFASIQIGKHLVFSHDRYLLQFGAEQTKTSRDQEGELPPRLTGWVDWYIEVHRQRLLFKSNAPTNALWINRFGEQLHSNGIRTQIEKRTRTEFGQHVWPHLFRAAAATGTVDAAPEDIGIASELLGHASIKTTEQHYILARGMVAHRAVQASISASRAEALKRLKNQRW